MKIDTYDSATPEPGYEDMSISEVIADIDEQWAEYYYYQEQDARETERELYRDWDDAFFSRDY